MFDNSFEDAESLVLKIITHLFIYLHSLPLPYTRKQLMSKAEAFLVSAACQGWQVLDCQSIWVFLYALELSESIFFPSLKPIPSSSEHIDLQSCTYSSYSSWCFCLQASPSHYFYIGHSVLTADANHTSYKYISKALNLWCFTHRKITLNLSFVPTVYIHLADFIWALVQNFKNFCKSKCTFNSSPCSLFAWYASEKRRVSCKAHREQLYHGKKKGSKLIMTCSHTTFGYDHLRSLIWEGPSCLHLLNRGPCRRAMRWMEVLLMVLFVALHSGSLASLPFWRSYVSSLNF